MRTYKIIPFDELRRQYRRGRELKDTFFSTLPLLLFFLGFTVYYLFI